MKKRRNRDNKRRRPEEPEEIPTDADIAALEDESDLGSIDSFDDGLDGDNW